MNYRQRLFANYVSGNKIFLYKAQENPDKTLFRWIRNTKRAIKPWLDQIPRTQKVLDTACGPGNILHLLRSLQFTNIHGVDISPEQVAIARHHFPQVVCDDTIEFLKLTQNEFALVTAFDILEHFNKEEAFEFLDAVYNALIPGGRIILQLPNGDSPFAGGIIFGDLTHEVTYTTVSLQHILISCGFKDIVFQEHGPQPTSLKGIVRYGLWKFLKIILRSIHLIETGGQSTGIYTRVMRATAVCDKKI
ncbi:MAG: class I SAM-dependent methyltransferase [SAR324 cluster bacterium]|nr:class I SAM-dependent methyltransferase [SAR324 cluster bacterium]